MFWRRRANQFVGYMTPDACSYVSSERGKRIIFNDDSLLTEEALWISDRVQDEEGNRGLVTRPACRTRTVKRGAMSAG